jgi:Geranylgeranyl pyrophosphate synthase
LAEVIKIVNDSGALDYCRQRATEETEIAIQALNALPDSEYRQALVNLAKLALHRIQ